MPLLAAFLLQATEVPPPPPPEPIDFDLRDMAEAEEPVSTRVTVQCDRGEGDEIVVCGARDRQARHRYRPLRALPEPQLPRATFGFDENTTLGAELQGHVIAPGIVSNRVLITLRRAF
ncbi:hypothetical protein FHS96_002085 [Sphingomonas zeicaulis]|uniref:hypothetical protein n=1 Tax=Sphingomonas zeicaulis TaxID=1632740 RepID=UPI003D241649